MDYFYLILQTLLFSFGGITIKYSGNAFSPFMTSLLRFLLGMTILFVIQKIRRKPITLKLANKWIIFGGIMKACHYLCENYGVMKGNSFGTVIVLPAQTFTVLLFSTFVMKEKMTRQKVFGTLLTIFGVLLLSWNGLPLDTFLNEQAYILWFYLFGGIAAAFFNIAQKKLVDSMDIISMNVSMFIYGALVCLCTIPFTMPAMTGSFGPLPAIGILTLGCCTGIGFLLQALAMRSVSVLIATVIQSSMSILSIFWSAVLYHDNVSIYAVIGTCIFVVGILLINIRFTSDSVGRSR